MKLLSVIFTAAFALLVNHASAQTWALPRDADGWSMLNPSHDSRIIYVSATDGNDATGKPYTLAEIGGNPRDPSIEIMPYKSIGIAMTRMRDNYPDWVLLKSGDTFPKSTIHLHNPGMGRNARERKVITYYGDSPQRPVILSPGLNAWLTGRALTQGGVHHWAIVGIEFYNAAADPHSSEYIAGTIRTGGSDLVTGGQNMLIEDCKFNFWELVIQGDGGRNSPWKNVEVRRNMFLNTYFNNSCSSMSSRPSGAYLSSINNYLIEENMVDYAGWNPDIAGAGRNQYNHGFYLQYNSYGELYFRGNIIARASGNAVQNRSGGLVEKNLVIQSPAGLFVAHDTDNGPGAAPGMTAVRHNVVLEGLGMGSCAQSSGANWAIPLSSTLKQGTVIEENIVAHNLNGVGAMGGIDNFSQCTYIRNILYDWGSVANTPNPGWNDPQRSVGKYNATIGGTATTDAFLAACKARPLRSWPENLSAYAVINYIRDGFDLDPITASTESGPVRRPLNLDIGASLINAQTDTYESAWLGRFREPASWSGWVLHEGMSWIYPAVGIAPWNAWFWSASLDSWVYTTEGFYPWVHAHADVIWPDQPGWAWLYFQSADPYQAWYYHTETEEWKILPDSGDTE